MTGLVKRLRAIAAMDLRTGPILAHTLDTAREAANEIERLHASSDEMLAVLNAARIMLKNRDQRPDEMKLLDAIKMVIANAEGVP